MWTPPRWTSRDAYWRLCGSIDNLEEVRRLIFWDFPRATWQYDVVVGLILIFIFATPRAFFHDQPKAAPVILISANQAFIAGELLDDVPAPDRTAVATNLIRQRLHKNWHIAGIKALRDEREQEVRGFIAYTSQPN